MSDEIQVVIRMGFKELIQLLEELVGCSRVQFRLIALPGNGDEVAGWKEHTPSAADHIFPGGRTEPVKHGFRNDLQRDCYRTERRSRIIDVGDVMTEIQIDRRFSIC